MSPRILLSAAMAVGLVAGCATPPAIPEHPLAGRLFDAPGAVEIDRVELDRRLAQADVVYLGEKHDNPHHHAAQHEVISALVAMGRRPAVAFEVASVPQTSTLMGYVASAATSHAGDPEVAAARLRARLGWDEAGERWRSYGPLLELARANGLRVAGIDLPRDLRARISRVGVAGLTALERAQLHGSGFEDAAYEQLMHARFKAAHCGYGRPDHLARLYHNWLARNDAMAMAVTTLAAEQPGEPVVVILGGGHVRDGMGVVERVAARAPGLRQLNVGLQEVGGEAAPGPYVAALEYGGRRFGPPHEVVWFTPPAPDAGPDPCEALREHMQKVGEARS